jgi:membrane glycosyltransferase
LFRTPEQTAPPAVLVRANELAKASRGLAASSPLLQLRDDQNLLETHLANLPGDRRRNRGQIDPDLAIARAKIEEAENLDEALGYLTTRETFAVLSSNALLRTVCAKPRGGE